MMSGLCAVCCCSSSTTIIVVILLPWIQFKLGSSCCANCNSSGWESLLFIANNKYKKHNGTSPARTQSTDETVLLTSDTKILNFIDQSEICSSHLIPVKCPPIFPLFEINIRGRASPLSAHWGEIAISHLISALFPGPSQHPWNYVPVTQWRCSGPATTTRDASESVRCCSAYAANISASSVAPSADWHSRRNAGTFVIAAPPNGGLRAPRSTVDHPARRLYRQGWAGVDRVRNRNSANGRSNPWRASPVRHSAIGRHTSHIVEWRRFWKDGK